MTRFATVLLVLSMEICLCSRICAYAQSARTGPRTDAVEQDVSSQANPDAPKVIVYGGNFESSPPKLIHWVAPELSDQGRIAHYRGICLVSLTVDRHGLPQNVRVVRPIGMGLDAKAIKVVKQFRFTPSLYNGQTISARVAIEVHFKADSFER